MEKDAKIYVAGHKGLAGSAIMLRLRELAYENIVMRTHKELDLTRQADVEEFFEKENPEYVFLAAARVGGILANTTYKAEFIYDNIMIGGNVIHSAYKYGVKKLLNLGSSCIYPKLAPQPMKEDYLLTGTLEPTNEPYAIAKITAIKLCRYYNDRYRTNFISVMPTNLYGPNDNYDLENSHVLPALIRKFHLAKLAAQGDWEGIIKDEVSHGSIPADFMANLIAITQSHGHNIPNSLRRYALRSMRSASIVLWGSGEPYREFLYVNDLADACMFLMGNYNYKEIGEFVNVGTGEEIKIKDLANLIKEIVGFDGKISHDLAKPDGTPRKLLDISRIRKLGWEPKVSLEAGIRKTYRWYIEQG